jgi:hypothetical protein
MADEAAVAGTTTPVPEQRTGGHEADPEFVHLGESFGSLRSVPFDRLLSVAMLTPAQASHVAVQLLDAAQSRGQVDGEHSAGTCLGAVTLTPSGDIDVAAAHPDGGTPVAELLGQLVQNARRLPAHPRPDQQLLLRRLEQVAQDPLPEPGARARELEAALADTLGSGARARLSGQLAALVDAFAHVAPSVRAQGVAPLAPGPVMPTTAPAIVPSAAPAARGSSMPVPRRTAPARPAGRPARRGRRLLRRTRGRRVAVVVLVLAAVLAGTGYVVLRGPGAGVIESLGLGGHPAAPATTAPAQPTVQGAKQPRPHRPQAVPALARRHAGPITGVVAQKAGSCKPGSLCPVKVTVRFRPASTSRLVRWKVGAARLCKHRVVWSPPTTMTARPGWTRVYAHSSVRIPRGRSLALFALTTAPSRAQSRPVPVTGSSLHC